MKPKVSLEFRKQISDLVHGPELQIGSYRMTWPRDLPIPFESVYPDVQHFRSQALEN
jgi:hypothetical protein